MSDFFDWDRADLEGLCRKYGVSLVHARSLLRSAYKKLDEAPWGAESLPRTLVDGLAATVDVSPPVIVSRHQSGYDHSVKFILALDDGERIETVLMPESKRMTLCVSTQVGCRQGCVFCHTGRMGLRRQLRPGEIVGQLVTANRWISRNSTWLQKARLPVHMRITNVVFMGMGEPLDNVEAVIKAIDIMTDPYGLALGPRRISVSTAGHLEGLKRLIESRRGIRLALSVHSPNDSKRSKIMPINRRWPLSQVMDLLRESYVRTGIPLLIQYTLIRGVNDSVEEATALSRLCQGMEAKINLIPLNEVAASRLESTHADGIQAFRDVLHGAGIRTMVRYSKGQDIAAACGQLVV